MRELEGKVAFISGAARGQGRSHALTLARGGASIVGFDLCGQIDTVPFPMASASDLAKTKRLVEEAGGTMVAVQADVRDQAEVDLVFEEGVKAFGRVDIVLANAAINHNYKRSWEIDDDGFRNVMDVNLVGVWHTIKAAIPTMIAQGQGGSIVMTGSGASLMGIPNLAGYVASKHALLGLMRTMAKELGRYQIRVNAVLPGNCNTPMFDNEGVRRLYVPDAEEPLQEVFLERAAAMSPMRQPYVEPEDISAAVLFLISPAGRYVSGMVLPVDGAGSTP